MNTSPLIVIAELSANHLGSLDRAIEIIHAAKLAGADYIKFQHLKPETITVRGAHPDLTVAGESLWAGRQLWDLYAEAMMPWEWTGKLVSVSNSIGLGWLSTPFDESAVDFLEDFDPPMYKVASFEIVDIPLIRHVASTGKPLIISTGMATADEIDAAVEAARNAGRGAITLLRTNSAYPAPIDEMDLAAIPVMKARWGTPVGLSDHSIGNLAGVVAASLGAEVFEKHITLRRSDGGPDAEFSSEPEEFKDYVSSVHLAYQALGNERLGPSEKEAPNRMFRPSLRAVRPISEGERFTSENVKSVRPSGGLNPAEIHQILGRSATREILVGNPITAEDIQSPKSTF